MVLLPCGTKKTVPRLIVTLPCGTKKTMSEVGGDPRKPYPLGWWSSYAGQNHRKQNANSSEVLAAGQSEVQTHQKSWLLAK